MNRTVRNVSRTKILYLATLLSLVLLCQFPSLSLSQPESGSVWTWGDNYCGELGNGTNDDSNIPVQVNISDVVDIAVGFSYSIAVRSDGTVWTWGENSRGQLGNGTNDYSNIPVQADINGVTAIGGGGFHSIALRSDGSVWAWGRNGSGQLGDGTNTDSNIPVQADISGVTAITGGLYHTIALKSDRTVWTWGWNSYGQLGNGTNVNSNIPVQVNISDVVAIDAGSSHSIAVKSDGTVWTWGADLNGELGNGTNVHSNIPVQASISGVTAIAGGDSHTIALKSDGTVWAWGANFNGQLGNGTNTDSNIPVRAKISGATAITGGYVHTIALKTNGTVWTWGWNYYGQLGNGTNVTSNIPVHVRISDVVAIAGGGYHSIALRSVPDITVTPLAIDFGAVNEGTTFVRTVLVENVGSANLKIGTITSPSSPFEKIADNCSGQTIAPNGSCTVKYRFAPTSLGAFSSNSNIPSNDPDEDPTTITLSGVGATGLSSVSGNVFDDTTGKRLSGVVVEIGGHSGMTNSEGIYKILNVLDGEQDITASKSGYYTHMDAVIVPKNSALTVNLTMKPLIPSSDVKILSVTSKYRGFVYYLDGVDHNVTYYATIDWGEHPPGLVEFKTPKATYTESASDSIAHHTFNMGTDFGPCGKLTLVAQSADGQRSGEFAAEFVVMKNTFGILFPLRLGTELGPEFYYKLDQGFNTAFIEEGIDAGIVPKEIPLFGENPVRIDFIPQVSLEITSEGEATLKYSWEDLEAGKRLSESWGREHNLKKIADLLREYWQKGRVDERRLPKARIGGRDLFFYPILDFEGKFNPSQCNWDIGGYVGFAGDLEIKDSWPFIFLAGPIPVPMYVKASFHPAADLQAGATAWPPQENLNGRFHFSPSARGALGSGVDDVLSVEGWIGGVLDVELQWPQEPTLEEVSIYFNGGVTITGFVWSWEFEAFRWDWEYLLSAERTTILQDLPLGFNEKRSPKLMRRDYLTLPGYGKFSQKPELRAASTEKASERYRVSSGAMQSSVFPNSKPNISSNGTNLCLVYLYDDPNRTSINRTVAVFSSWDGIEWGEPVPIGDDGTADFSPQILTFTDGSAIAAWEDVSSVLANTAAFEDMVAALEISVATYDPITKQWSPAVRMTSNGYLDRTPRLAGVSPTNVMLTWVSNEANDVRGNAENPNKVWYAKWDGTQWSQPQVVAQLPNGIVRMSTAYDGQKAHATMTVDTDDHSETIEDYELFNIAYDSGLWSEPVRLTTDTLLDENPQLAIDSNGHFILSWVKGNDLVTATDFDIDHRQVVTTNEYSTSFADFKMVQASNDRIAMLWSEASENDSDIYAIFYDPSSHAWGNPQQLTLDPETERYLSAAFYGDSTVIAVYNRVQMETSQVSRTLPSGKIVTFAIPKPGETDLYMLKYVIGGDIGLKESSLEIDPPNPAPGTEVTFTVTAVNLGDVTLSNIPVTFYHGNPSEGGIEIGRSTITESFNSGGEAIASIHWVIPETLTPLSIYVVIDPDTQIEDRDRSNNVLNGNFVKPDLAIQSASWSPIGKDVISITARVTNQGAIQSPAISVTFRMEAKTGKLLSTKSIPSLKKDSSVDVNFLWDISDNVSPHKSLWIRIDESNKVDDYDRSNNSHTVVIDLLRPDITVDPVSPSFGTLVLGGSSDQTITVRNDGTADLTLGAIGSPSGAFSRIGGTCSDNQTLPSGESCSILVRFSPLSEGLFKSSFTITSNDPNESSLKVSLKGTTGLNLVSPNGGEEIASGSYYDIQWQAPPQAEKFKLYYSLDNGTTWKFIAGDLTGTSYNWPVPKTGKNQTRCLIKMIGFTGSGIKVGEDKSDAPFSIEVIKITSPEKGDEFLGGNTHAIRWTTNETIRPVVNAQLFYSLDGGSTWKPMRPPVTGDPGIYYWTLPPVLSTKTQCKVKLVLKDVDGKIVGSAVSGGNFTIQPH